MTAAADAQCQLFSAEPWTSIPAALGLCCFEVELNSKFEFKIRTQISKSGRYCRVKQGRLNNSNKPRGSVTRGRLPRAARDSSRSPPRASEDTSSRSRAFNLRRVAQGMYVYLSASLFEVVPIAPDR
mmetsp:Transcript_7557/g.14998  ORF Transcript_7557/g.14998 Transcript_7557/m.14998 type:complete len:127 (-) Transcript_7557:664-1044(-)